MSEHSFTAPSPEDMQALLPAYEFHSVLASNERGAVYYATQKSLDRKVALKIFAPMVANDPSFKRLYANCTSSVAGLRHPNLISLYNSGFADSMPYLVMEFVPGKSLARSMKGDPVEFSLAMTILKEVCEGVAHAHEKQLIHGNLSPHDILLNQKASPKIGNFGLGPDVHTLEGVEVPDHFTAPEVLDGEAPTEASDLYSLAAIFYELITATPWRFGGPAASSLEDSPKAVDEVLANALSKEPDNRGTDALKFFESLRQAAKPKKKTSSPAPGEAKPRANAAAKTMPAAILKASNTPLVKIIAILVLLIAIQQVWSYRKSLKEDRAQGGGKKQTQQVIHQHELIRVQRPRPQPQQPVNKPPEDFSFPEDAETPMDSLERLREALVQGSRNDLPLGAITKGDSHYFLVEQAMTWADAQAFAERHGGYLALPGSQMDWRQADPIRGRSIWLGAARGTDSFILLDGKPWKPTGEISGTGAFAWTDADGNFRSAAPEDSKSFVIQWRADGSNPASLESRLANAAASIKSTKPIYPLGTLAMGERHYLALAHEATWEEARALAESAGGHLAVLSDERELGLLQKVAASCPSCREFWTAGHLADESWVWTTPEPWRAVAWQNERSAAEDGAAMFLRAGMGMDAQGRSDRLAGFIIEWSRDAETNKPPANPSPGPGDEIADLATKAKELVIKAGVDKEAAHKKNTDKLAWDLDAHYRGLNKSSQQQLKPEMDKLKECVQNNRLLKETIDASGARPTAFMAKLCNYIIGKQAEIDEQHATKLKVLHASYLTKLGQLRDQAKEAGQIKAQLKATDLIESAQNYDTWIASMSN